MIGIESRGFVFASPVALGLGLGLALVRKAGKLPHRTIQQTYTLEYGTDSLEIHSDSIQPGQRVLIIDDVLATGGTAAAAARLVEALGGHVAAILFLLEIAGLKGRERLADYSVYSLNVFK